MNVGLWTSLPLRRGAIGAAALSAALLSIAAAQAPDYTEEWEVPRTPHGHPDLQGNWTNATLTPFQRPEGQGPVLTWDEVAEIEGAQADFVAESAAPSDPDRLPPPAGGVDPNCIDTPTGCYNDFYRERGERVALVNGEPRSSLITDPADGRVPKLTDEARQSVEDARVLRSEFGPYDHPEIRPLGERCLVSGNPGPPMLPSFPYNNNYTIVQNADHVMIMAEMMHDVRVIRLGEPASVPNEIRPWFGGSWGRWEEDTLVVETTNLNPDQALWGVPPSEDRVVTERFTRIDEETILYEFTIGDPTTYTSVWGGQIPFKQLDALLYEYACHEGNYGLSNVLSGARYVERTESTDGQR